MPHLLFCRTTLSRNKVTIYMYNCAHRTSQLCHINKNWPTRLANSCVCGKVVVCDMHSSILQRFGAIKLRDKFAGVTSVLISNRAHQWCRHKLSDETRKWAHRHRDVLPLSHRFRCEDIVLKRRKLDYVADNRQVVTTLSRTPSTSCGSKSLLTPSKSLTVSDVQVQQMWLLIMLLDNCVLIVYIRDRVYNY